MITNWLVKFVDGTAAVIAADVINDAFGKAQQEYGKHVRSASFHSSFTDSSQPVVSDDEFGYGWGKLA